MSASGDEKGAGVPFGTGRGVPNQGAPTEMQTSDGGTGGSQKAALPGGSGRIEWFDYAKGICILLVVMLHSTLGVGEAFAARGFAPEGFMHWIVAYAKPFRMPDFFMLSGLFLAYAIGRGWMHYLDKKVVHFLYFYIIWTVILATLKTTAKSGLDAEALGSVFLDAIVSPYVTLWFIYILPIYFVVTKLLRPLPAWALLGGAVLLKTIPIHTGWTAIDDFAVEYYVFFLGGYLLAPYIFKAAEWASNNVAQSLALIAGWAVLNGVMAFTPSPFAHWETLADLPLVSIAIGGLGATAIILIASLLSKFDPMPFIRFCGANSIVLYISFTLPMGFTRILLLKTGVVTDTGLAAMIVWMVACVAPLLVYMVLRHTPLRMLYERPAWAQLPYKAKSRSMAPSLAATAPHMAGRN